MNEHIIYLYGVPRGLKWRNERYVSFFFDHDTCNQTLMQDLSCLIIYVFSVTNKENEDESYEMIDLAEHGWLRKAVGDLTKASVAKQITVGGVSGW